MPPEVVIPLGFFIFTLCAWTISTYNKFVRYRNKIEESWSAIDVALKRRANLIPNLIRITEGYINHEARIFQGKNKISDKTDDQQRLVQENEISRSLGGLLALAEAYYALLAQRNLPHARPFTVRSEGGKNPSSFNLTSALYHISGARPFTFECPHGLVNDCQVTLESILDIQLTLYEAMIQHELDKKK